jgi:cell division protein FtsW (lipid II flippase)
MAFFALGTLLLKFKRQDLRRSIVCPWWMAILGLVLVFVAFIGPCTHTPTQPLSILPSSTRLETIVSCEP